MIPASCGGGTLTKQNSEESEAEIDNMEIIPIAVDVRIFHATGNLNIADTQGFKQREVKSIIRIACRNAVAKVNTGGPPGISGTSVTLDSVLWSYGKYGCSHCEKSGEWITIGSACSYCRF